MIEDNFNDMIKVGVMLPLSGEHSEIGNLILNASYVTGNLILIKDYSMQIWQ